jgi:hypothetical protein
MRLNRKAIAAELKPSDRLSDGARMANGPEALLPARAITRKATA